MTKTCFSFLLLTVPLFFSCHNSHTDNTSTDKIQTIPKTPENYSYALDKPDRTRKLPDALAEVSGNTWMDSAHLILIEDLHPNLYFVKLTDTAAVLEKTVSFEQTDKEKTDIEDVAYTGDAVYALWSHGVLFKITDWESKPTIQTIETGLDKKNNTEGLCFDPVSKYLLIACKDDAGEDDEKKSDKGIYQFDPVASKLISPPFMTIRKKDFKELTGEKLKFNPSAIAVHPITHDIYILTTRDNKGLAVFTHEGVLKSYQPMDKLLMPQPEGICFSASGIMYISSEGKKGESGNLFEFSPHH